MSLNPLYTDLRVLASELITEFGKLVSISSPATVEGPSYAPTVTNTTPSQARFVEIQDVQMLSGGLRPLVQQGDVTGVLQPDPTEIPTTKSKIGIDGKTFRVVAIEPVNPGGLNLLFELVLRK